MEKALASLTMEKQALKKSGVGVQVVPKLGSL